MTNAEKASRVLASQGRAAGVVSYLPDVYVASLAALCADDGTVGQEAVRQVPTILRAIAEEAKATVDGGELGRQEGA